MAMRVDFKGSSAAHNYKDDSSEEMPDVEMVELRFPKLPRESSDVTLKASAEGVFARSLPDSLSHIMEVPDIAELRMKKSWLRTQLVAGAAFYIIGDNFVSIVKCTLMGTASGAVVGAAVGGTIGGITTGGPGVVPGIAVGVIIGGAIGFGSGGAYGLYKGTKKAKGDVEILYRDFKILGKIEDADHKSMQPTIKAAHDFFISFLEQVNEKEEGLRIFCTLSKEVMIIPVKAQCEHVYELLSITESLQNSINCPLCRKPIKIKKLIFDFPTINAVKAALKKALDCLQEAAGTQEGLLLQKHVLKRDFSNSDNVTEEKIRKVSELSLAEKRTLSFIANHYLEKQRAITAYVKDELTLMLRDAFIANKITQKQRWEMEKKVLEGV